MSHKLISTSSTLATGTQIWTPAYNQQWQLMPTASWISNTQMNCKKQIQWWELSQNGLNTCSWDRVVSCECFLHVRLMFLLRFLSSYTGKRLHNEDRWYTLPTHKLRGIFSVQTPIIMGLSVKWSFSWSISEDISSSAEAHNTHLPYIPSVIFVRFIGRRILPVSAFRLFIFFPPLCQLGILAAGSQQLLMKNHLKQQCLLQITPFVVSPGIYEGEDEFYRIGSFLRSLRNHSEIMIPQSYSNFLPLCQMKW